MKSYRVAELKSKARKSGSGSEFGATDASTSGGMGFYVHDVQPIEGAGLRGMIMKSPTAILLKWKGLRIRSKLGSDIAKAAVMTRTLTLSTEGLAPDFAYSH